VNTCYETSPTRGPLLAHIILGSLHTDPIVQLVRSGQARRLTAALRDIATALLDC
jgi:hypothetical protein